MVKIPDIIKRILSKFRKPKSIIEQVKTQAAQTGVALPVIDPVKIKKEPKIYISQHAVRKLIRGTEVRPDTETGEALIGLIIPSSSPEILEPTIFVLDTIVPDDSAVRLGAYFETGDDLAAQTFIWLSRNWEELRRLSKGKIAPNTLKELQPITSDLIPPEFDFPLRHIGHWHKHPEMLRVPSGGDLGTARDFVLEDNGMDQILVPVTTYHLVRRERFWWDGDKFLLRDDPDDRISISFSYLSRKMLERGENNFLRVEPEIVHNSLIPKLPTLPWHLKNPKRFEREITLMKDYGCQVGVLIREMTGAPPMEISFTVQKQGWRNRLLIVTSADYPDTAPQIKIFNSAGVEEKMPEKPQEASPWFSAAWEKTRGIFRPQPAPQKPPDKFLIQHIWNLEREKRL